MRQQSALYLAVCGSVSCQRQYPVECRHLPSLAVDERPGNGLIECAARGGSEKNQQASCNRFAECYSRLCGGPPSVAQTVVAHSRCGPTVPIKDLPVELTDGGPGALYQTIFVFRLRT